MALHKINWLTFYSVHVFAKSQSSFSFGAEFNLCEAQDRYCQATSPGGFYLPPARVPPPKPHTLTPHFHEPSFDPISGTLDFDP